MYTLETIGLSHHFSANEPVLDNINLKITQGSIYGFLGPNGAGKTTTLKLILGLLDIKQGQIFVFGKSFKENRVPILQQVGSLIESPSLYGHLTAKDNLSLLQKVYRCPKDRIEKVLDLVGLPDTGNKKAGQFSLGMKQRLGIAIALLHNPSFLILDEPTNGLDPNGMIETRALLLRLNREFGITILISSHLLDEIEKLVTDIGIINKGKLLFQGTLHDLKARQQELVHIHFDTSNNQHALKIIRANDIAGELKDNKLLLPALSKSVRAKLNLQLIEQGLEVYEISESKRDLESIFMHYIND